MRPAPPALEGAAFEDARRQFADAVLVGFIAPDDGCLTLNPAGDAMLPAGARLVLVGRDGVQLLWRSECTCLSFALEDEKDHTHLSKSSDNLTLTHCALRSCRRR